MTTKEFYEILGNSKGWKLNEDGDGGVIRKNTRKRCYCPVTYVAWKKLHKFQNELNYQYCGEKLHLNPKFVESVAEGADGVKNTSHKTLKKVLNLRKGK